MLALAWATASLTSRNGITTTTGPKISSRATVMSLCTWSRTVGCMNQPLPPTVAGSPP